MQVIKQKHASHRPRNENHQLKSASHRIKNVNYQLKTRKSLIKRSSTKRRQVIDQKSASYRLKKRQKNAGHRPKICKSLNKKVIYQSNAGYLSKTRK